MLSAEREAKDLEALKQMFEVPGWAVMVREIEEEIEVLADEIAYQAQNMEDIWHKRGVMEGLNRIVHQQGVVQFRQESLDNPQGDEEGNA